MKKSDVVAKILPAPFHLPTQQQGLGYAPTNIALCKYWGKRDQEINLPMTSSLSVSIPEKGALTTISLYDHDKVTLNDKEISQDSNFFKRMREFLDLFCKDQPINLKVDIKMNVPVAAGLASSACGFASLVSALNDLFHWQLGQRQLSILARLGSGSAARSLWNGFVEWHAGVQPDGMDSYAEPLPFEWPELRIGILMLVDQEKSILSRSAMQQTMNSSLLYAIWPKKVARDLVTLRQALQIKNFSLLGGTSESNALTMHATMLSSWPPICYFVPETIGAMHKVWDLRKNGLEIYFTEDAGPNLKLLFLEKDEKAVKTAFPQLDVVRLFD